jgi:hypothetical protein
MAAMGGSLMKSMIWMALLALAVSVSAADDIVKTISHGEAVDLDKERVSGKYMVVEFYADW